MYSDTKQLKEHTLLYTQWSACQLHPIVGRPYGKEYRYVTQSSCDRHAILTVHEANSMVAHGRHNKDTSIISSFQRPYSNA